MGALEQDKTAVFVYLDQVGTRVPHPSPFQPLSPPPQRDSHLASSATHLSLASLSLASLSLASLSLASLSL